MRRARLTFQGAFHHVMNRALHSEQIFETEKTKRLFLQLLARKTTKYKIGVLAYCIMKNHYHLVLRNTSGLLSDYMRELNGDFGMYYRKMQGGYGYVFAGRFKSILVQDGKYLQTVIQYVLLNPVRAGYAQNPFQYQWSSIGKDMSQNTLIIDHRLLRKIFPSESDLMNALTSPVSVSLDPKWTRAGSIIGNSTFIREALKKFDRRKEQSISKRKRIIDYTFVPVRKVIFDFEKKYCIKFDDIDINSIKGKRLRNELLVLLKEKAGMKFTEIQHYPLFQTLKYSSLSKIYHRTRKNTVL